MSLTKIMQKGQVENGLTFFESKAFELRKKFSSKKPTPLLANTVMADLTNCRKNFLLAISLEDTKLSLIDLAFSVLVANTILQKKSQHSKLKQLKRQKKYSEKLIEAYLIEYPLICAEIGLTKILNTILNSK